MICIAAMIIPFAVSMIPVYLMFSRLGWIGTYLPLFVPDMLSDAYYPLSKPVLAVVGLLQFMFSWGIYIRPLIYITERRRHRE